jgi:hypothetical protein
LAGEAYAKRYAAGFTDSDNTKPVDAQFLNAVETALLRLLGADPIDQGVQTWDAGLARMKSIKLTATQIDAAAGILKSQLASLGLVNADISASAAIALSKLGQSGAATAQGIVWDGTSWSAKETLPWLIDIDVFPTAISQTNWDILTADSAGIYAYRKDSSGSQNAEINWNVILAAGTWTVELIFLKDTNACIYSVQFDSVEKGTIDSYAASTTRNTRASVAGITVATTGKVQLKLKMATKNASSSSYVGYLQHVQLRRTA